MKKQYDNILDMLYDRECYDNILLVGANGQKTEFRQVALVPIEEKNYVILQPVDPVEGVGEGEALVFAIDDEKKGLVLERRADYISKVFEIYERIIDDYNDNNFYAFYNESEEEDK